MTKKKATKKSTPKSSPVGPPSDTMSEPSEPERLPLEMEAARKVGEYLGGLSERCAGVNKRNLEVAIKYEWDNSTTLITKAVRMVLTGIAKSKE